MIGYTKSFCPVHVGEENAYNKWAFSADYATGKNTIGGYGVAVTYYFMKNFYIETGPAWFNSKTILGPWKWSLQVSLLY